MNRRVLMLTLFLALFIVVFCLPLSASAKGKDIQRRVVLVVCDYLQLQDLDREEYKNLRSFFDKSGVALLNTNTAGSRSRPNVAATVSAGSVALGTVQETLAFGPQENYQGEDPLVLFQARTGCCPKKNNVVVLDIPYILRENETEKVKAYPGALGEALHKRGMVTGVLGNADLPGLPQRSMAVIAMDRCGIIDMGKLDGGLLKIERNTPLIYNTDYIAMKSQYLKLRDKCNLLVIELGDLVRLEQSRQFLTDKVYFRERNRILQEYDRFIGWLVKNTSLESTQIMVASFVPTSCPPIENRFFGFIGVMDQRMRSGLLVSPTTRREGIVTLYDIAPSICSYLKAPMTNFAGRPWRVVQRKDSVSYIQGVDKRAVFTSLLRPLAVKGYVILHLVVLASTIFCLSLKPRIGKYLSPVLLGLLAVPMVWLLVSAFSIFNAFLYLVLCLALVFFVVFLSLKLVPNKDLDPLLFLCLATVVVLFWDTVSGCNLQEYSVLSYDAMSGARFYGLGNEYMGTLIGSLVMGSSLLLQRVGSFDKRIPLLVNGLLFLSAVVILGAPVWGSNFGGLLASLVAFVYTFCRFIGVKLKWKHVLIGGLMVLVLASGFMAWDAARPPESRSHFGQLIANIEINGLSALSDVVVRKLAMNYRLIRYTIWTRVLLGSLLALGVLFYRPVGIFRKVLKSNPAVAVGLEGALIGAFAALVFNDSGIVAAATGIIFPAAILFYLVLREIESVTPL